MKDNADNYVLTIVSWTMFMYLLSQPEINAEKEHLYLIPTLFFVCISSGTFSFLNMNSQIFKLISSPLCKHKTWLKLLFIIEPALFFILFMCISKIIELKTDETAAILSVFIGTVGGMVVIMFDGILKRITQQNQITSDDSKAEKVTTYSNNQPPTNTQAPEKQQKPIHLDTTK
ncbi:hypothetical protein LMH66_11180 [Shewanella sp. 10N.7]|uniref:hypothetical protein n=1 Tax=Shewanella sp. 10N.7 TaxID=2885093 RepID=UPI001E28D7F8|nr:hypothetical protein [Shewanella sp. 10N.7]MCC4833192.1 hypothetical protein [Shewanella sp. 10N.7]